MVISLIYKIKIMIETLIGFLLLVVIIGIPYFIGTGVNQSIKDGRIQYEKPDSFIEAWATGFIIIFLATCSVLMLYLIGHTFIYVINHFKK
jgi:hypothetical protein